MKWVINIISVFRCVCVKRILFIWIDSLSHVRLVSLGWNSNVSCSRTQTVAVPQVWLEPIALRSRVKHSTIKSLCSLTNFALWVKLQWGFISLYTGLWNCPVFNMRGSRTFCHRGSKYDFLFYKRFSWWGDRGSKCHDKRVVFGPPAKLACRWWLSRECLLCSLVIFQGIQTSVAKKSYIFVILFKGGGVRIPCPSSGSAHV